MPTPQRKKYFPPGSRLAGVRYNVTNSTVDRVAASMATQKAHVVVVSAISMVVHEELIHAVIKRSRPH